MRILYWLTTIYIALYLSACATTPFSQTPPTKTEKVKDPLTIAVYTQKQKVIKMPYKIIGQASIPEYNPGGIKRQAACLYDTLRTMAASMGGDAIINIIHHNKQVIGTVIAYQPSEKQKTG
ncbi:MAG: hypothetical protein K0R24_1455 [Gammaproteobacteria bacterium]|jgi:hypothetical protein|nr:hypothetical protein [Gammaproteobacteria bacterium]